MRSDRPGQPSTWHFSLEAAGTGEWRGFRDLEALLAYLARELAQEATGTTGAAGRVAMDELDRPKGRFRKRHRKETPMTRTFSTLLVFALVLVVVGPSFAPVEGSSLPTYQELPEVRHFTPGGVEAPVIRGLPERPERQYPIPYHRPGQPAKISIANGARLAEAYGLTEPLTMTTALELGVLDDPFQGNYRLVDWDQILMVGVRDGTNQVEAVGLQAAELITASPQLATPFTLPNLWQETAWNQWHGVGVGAMAADLDGDGWDESIATFSDPVSHDFRLAVGQLGEHAGRLTSAPAVALFDEGGTAKLRAAVRGYDGGVWIRTYEGTTWGAWQPLGGYVNSAPAVAGGADLADLYYLDAGGELWRIDTLGGSAETLGAPPGVALTLDPAAAMSDTSADVFARGADNALWHRARQDDIWSDWESLGGFLTSSPAAVWSSSDRLDVVARGPDDALWQRVYSGGAWGAWGRVGGELASAPAITARGAGMLDVFALNADGEALHLAYAGGAWGSWENLGAPSGGALTSTPAAAWQPSGGIHLLGRGPDDALWQSVYTGTVPVSWEPRGRLPEYVITEIPWDVDAGRRKHIAGHFLGDGREQLVMFVTDSGSGGWLDLYEASRTGGFFLEWRDNYPVEGGILPNQGDTMAVGDFDADGLDEFAVALADRWVWILEIQQVDAETHQIAALAGWENPADSAFTTYSLAAGDLDGDGKDELLLGEQIFNGIAPWKPKWRVLELSEGSLSQKFSKEMDCGGYTHCALAMGAGNLDGAGRDEIVTAMAHRNTSSWEGFVSVVVYEMNDTLTAAPEWGSIHGMDLEYSNNIHHYVLAADFDRNLKDELVLQFDDAEGAYPNTTIVPRLRVLWLNPDHTLGQLPGGWFSNFGTYQTWVDVAVGNLTGQGLRVGAPTVRYQNEVRGIEAIISEPPKHKDVFGGVEYDVNASDQETYAWYEQSVDTTKKIEIKAQRDWTLDAEGSATIGEDDGTHVKVSLGASYGDHFETAFGGFEALLMQTTSQANASDLVVYTRSDFQVWEYPLYQNDSIAPVAFMTVVFQQGDYGLETSHAWGSGCDFWYRPNHQNHNVWSYPQNEDGFVNIDPERGSFCDDDYDVGAGAHTFEVAWQEGQLEQLTSEVKWDIKAGLEGQVGGDSFLGYNVPYQVNFETNASYGETTTELQSMEATEGTKVGAEVNNLPPSYQVSAAYNVQPCLYWSRAGYLVLDWIADPGDGDFWDLNYNHPDPAFIHLYEEGQCSILGTDYSSDVYVDPPKAAPGDVVTATAIVRNFSSLETVNVNVRWYAGDPDAGGTRIMPAECAGAGVTPTGGDCRAASLPGRARQEVSAVFTAGVAGEQRIYAVLDPDRTITEVHEDNNKAYGRMQIAAADYMDPGAVLNVPPAIGIDHSYAWFEFTDPQGNPTSAFVPRVALSEMTRAELRPVLSPPSPPSGLVSAHHAFDLLAFSGASGSDWVEPIDLIFGDTLPSALAVVHYSDADVGASDEAGLTLLRWTGTDWDEAVCAGMDGQVVHSLAENWLLVPVCRTGSYALFQPGAPGSTVYLPLVLKALVP